MGVLDAQSATLDSFASAKDRSSGYGVGQDQNGFFVRDRKVDRQSEKLRESAVSTRYG